MKLTTRQYATLLAELAADAKQDPTDTARSVIGYLTSRRERARLPAIIAEYERRERVANRSTPLSVASARTLSSAERQALVAIGERLFHKKITQSTTRVIPELLGGVVLKTDEERFDVSYATTLTALRRTLAH